MTGIRLAVCASGSILRCGEIHSHVRCSSDSMIHSDDFPPRKVRYSKSAPRFQYKVWSIPFINRLFKRFPLTGAGTHGRTHAPERINIKKEMI